MIHNQSPFETKQSIKQEDTLAFPVDIETFIQAIPENACTKGHFVNQNRETIQQQNPSALPRYSALYPDKFASFRDIPLRVSVRSFYDAALFAFPGNPPAEAMRKIGRLIYPQVLNTMLGRVIFAALRSELVSIFRNGPRAFELFEKNGTRLTFTELGPKHFRYDFDPSYSPIETSQVGIIEGAALYCGVKTEIIVQRKDLVRGSLECRW